MTVGETDVLYCDNHLLCINKPAGMLSQGDRSGDPDLLTWGRQYIERRFDKPGRAFIGLVHRLDRPVSGVMVFARTSKAAARLGRQFRDRTVSKRYLAIVEGRLSGSGLLRDQLRKEGSGVVGAPAHSPQGRMAELRWTAVGWEGTRTLVEVDLLTGRKHQIRFQLANAGHPVVGDIRYGARTELDGRNIALHCFHLSFQHPTRPEPVRCSALPPQTWGSFHDRSMVYLDGLNLGETRV